MVNEINAKAMQQKQAGGLTGDDLLNSAKIYEESRDFIKAIDTYMEIEADQFPNDPRSLEYAWERAVELVMKFDRSRVQDVTATACQKLMSIGRHEIAAELFESIGQTEYAVKTYMQGHLYERAKQCA